jgi:NAD(P)-dependent dehydrogenase (short-subunit alcohol dehydrogenase family)
VFSLSNKVIVQIGGSGLLGRALTSALGASGAQLVVASRNRGAIEENAPAAVEIEELDLQAESSLLALRDRVLARHARIDGMVFNVVSRPMRTFADDLEKWRASMEINATGLFAASRVFGDVMAGQRRGSIVNIASIQGQVGTNPWLYEGTDVVSPPDYFFQKGGMINLTRYLASHYGKYGVRINAVSPGGILHPDRPPPGAFLERYGQMTMVGRMANADEIPGAVIFLLSDAASYVTGINLPVDGGYTAK